MGHHHCGCKICRKMCQRRHRRKGIGSFSPSDWTRHAIFHGSTVELKPGLSRSAACVMHPCQGYSAVWVTDIVPSGPCFSYIKCTGREADTANVVRDLMAVYDG